MPEFPRLDVLAIAAHRDDVEIVSGGTIIKLVEMGYKVGLVDLTAGEAGSRGDPQQREKEARKAARVMGVAFRCNLGLPDAGLFVSQENALAVAKVVASTRPELVILPYGNQRHPDHTAAEEIGYRGCFLAGLAKLLKGLKPHRPRKIIYACSFQEVRPTFVVDISGQFKRKCQAVACYRSQFAQVPGKREVYPPARDIFDFMEIQNRRYGYMIGVRYGEAFFQREMLGIEDPMCLTGKSI